MHGKIIKTKKALRNAYMSLVSEKEADDISVSELCRIADVNRGTFYKYYSVPEDIFYELLDEIVHQSPVFATDNKLTVEESMTEYCRNLYNNRNLAKVYLKYGGGRMMKEGMHFLNKIGRGEYMEGETARFMAGGFIELIIYWMENDFDNSPEEEAKLILSYIARLVEM